MVLRPLLGPGVEGLEAQDERAPQAPGGRRRPHWSLPGVRWPAASGDPGDAARVVLPPAGRGPGAGPA
eukprot:9989163-Alexandrium_andersonii.AAC.1